jgi:outer membrane protein
MKNSLITLLFVVSLSAYGQRQMSLEECISYALANNPNIKSAQAAITESEARVGEYLATGFPQITGSADLGNNFVIPTTFVPAIIFDPNAPADQLAPVQFGTQYTGRASLDLNQMIFNGSYFVGLKAAKTYTELSKKELINSEIDVVAAIKKAYYSVLVNHERHSLVMKNYQRLDSLLQQTKIMYENGFVEKIDVNRIQVQFNNISQTLRNSETGKEVSIKILKFQMGMPMQEVIIPSDNLKTLQFTVLTDHSEERFTYHDRIEYSKLEVNKALVELDIKNVRVQ